MILYVKKNTVNTTLQCNADTIQKNVAIPKNHTIRVNVIIFLLLFITVTGYSQCEIYKERAETLFAEKKYEDAKRQYLNYKECKPNASDVDGKIAECDRLISVTDNIIAFSIIDEKPMFNGKEAAVGFHEWVSSVIVYPPEAHRKGITGRVFTEFIIDKDGSIIDINILRGADPLLNEEALRVLRMSPKWSPGRIDGGKPVKVRYQFPFVFQLN